MWSGVWDTYRTLLCVSCLEVLFSSRNPPLSLLSDPHPPTHAPVHTCACHGLTAGVPDSPPWCSSRAISRLRVLYHACQNREETALKQLPHPRLPQPACVFVRSLTSGSPDSGPVGRDGSRGGAREPEGPGVPGVHPEDVLPAAHSDPFLPGACPDLMPSPARNTCCRGADRPPSVSAASSLRLRRVGTPRRVPRVEEDLWCERGPL